MIRALFRQFHPLEQLEKQRQAECKKDRLSELAAPLFEHPVPEPDSLITDLTLVVLDFETTGLDLAADQILSIGSVEIRRQVLSLSSARHYYLLAANAIRPETAVINHIVPETLAGGMTEQEGVAHLVSYLAGKVIVAHGAEIEKQFLRRALQLPAEVPLPLAFLDTLNLERSLADNRGKVNQDLRLCQIRAQKGLPPYLAHNAFADAVATGELLLVLLRQIFADQPARLGPLVRRSLTGRV